MAIVTGQNRDRAVARPPWVRRHDNQHEPVVAGIMLALVIVGIAVFLFWGPLLRLAVTGAWFHAPGAPTERPAEGATPPGPPVVVTLDQPVLPSQAAVDAGAVASSALGAPPAKTAHTDLIAEPAPAGLVGPSALVAAAPEIENSSEAEAAAANDAAETAQAATAVPTAAPAASATPRATPAATAAPTSAPTSVAAASGRRARVVRTGGRGVVMYSAPRDGARLPAGVLEGAVVVVLDTASGGWTRVQVDGGRSGWVRSEFLAPAN